jgi:DNA-binding Lrp family transcriptional regulator
MRWDLIKKALRTQLATYQTLGIEGVSELEETLRKVEDIAGEWVAEIRYANQPDEELVIARVAARDERDAERKVQEYIRKELGGLRSYKISLYDCEKP